MARRLSLALKTSAEIANRVTELKEVLSKMKDRQKSFFYYLVRGHNELEAVILSGRAYELAHKIPFVYNNKGKSMKTEGIKTLGQLSKLRSDSYEMLAKIAQDHVELTVGDLDYKDYLVDLKFFFQMISPDAFKVVTEIMESERVAPQTRLTAAIHVLDRAGYATDEINKPEPSLPYKLVINYNQQNTQNRESETIEGQTVQDV